MNLSLILNILNFVLGGFVTTLGWLFATVMSAALIITLPYTRSCWEICKMSLLPFGNGLIHVKYLWHFPMSYDYRYSNRSGTFQHCQNCVISGGAAGHS